MAIFGIHVKFMGGMLNLIAPLKQGLTSKESHPDRDSAQMCNVGIPFGRWSPTLE